MNDPFPQTHALHAHWREYMALLSFFAWLPTHVVGGRGDDGLVTRDSVFMERTTTVTTVGCPGPKIQHGVPSITPCVGGKVLNYRRDEVPCEVCGGSGRIDVRDEVCRPISDPTPLVLAYLGIDHTALQKERAEIHRRVQEAVSGP